MNRTAIICVDDEQTILDSLKMELETTLGDNYLIEITQGGEEALEVFSELVEDNYEVALVISDYIMPNLKGDELLKRIHNISPKTLKIMLTGQADLEAVGNVINYAKLYRYIPKPWQADDLRITVKEALYSYSQDKALAEKNAQLQTMNKALEQSNREQADLISQLHENENRLRQFLEAMPVGVCVTDAKGKPYLINKAGQQISDRAIIESATGSQLQDTYQIYLAGTEQLYPKAENPILRALQGESVAVDDMEIRQRDKMIPVEAWGTPIYDQDGNVAYAIAAFQDITERKRAEAERERLLAELSQLNQDLQQANAQLEDYSHNLEEKVEQRTVELKAAQQQIVVQEKLASLGALTAGIAHELRNPLNFVNNYAEGSVELVEEAIEELDNQSEHLDPDAVDYLKEILTDIKENSLAINKHGNRADGIISSMMLHARSESSQHQLTDLNELLAEAVQLVYHSKRASDNRFNITIDTDYDNSIEQLELVSNDLSRAFINLLDNSCYAVQAKQQSYQSNPDQVDEAFTPTLRVKTQNLEQTVEIRIRDNGIGIPPKIQEKIFHPFFTTKPTGEGTGLGLSMTHDIIVGQHGGTLKLETEVGAYSEFIITLPKPGE
ncbi:MAG: response regulator [Moorea sp. SIOASIH]|uniref:ATP-binding protein n=1 Tax=Moorena sp. SIOASIH TaxID=2607817 RepID=UPI0013BE69D0|nr:ATP-binding protein [Moorena sp. SIOASIH]NEO35457.1 response regulator [Moorena sp. SIOASIH]